MKHRRFDNVGGRVAVGGCIMSARSRTYNYYERTTSGFQKLSLKVKCKNTCNTIMVCPISEGYLEYR